MLSRELMAALSADGIEIRTTAEIERIVRNGHDDRRNTLTVRISDGTAIEAVDSVLWAIGRKPNVDALDLAAAGVETVRGGAIVTDAFQRTSVDGVYAIGDVTGRAPLTPGRDRGRPPGSRIACSAGRRTAGSATTASRASSSPIRRSAPSGATEAEARAEHGDAVKVYETRFNPMYYAFSEHPRPTAMKLVTLGDDERVIGCHVIGDGADEMMQGFAVAVRMGGAQARSGRHRGDPSDERGRARDHAVNGVNMNRTGIGERHAAGSMPRRRPRGRVAGGGAFDAVDVGVRPDRSATGRAVRRARPDNGTRSGSSPPRRPSGGSGSTVESRR